MTFAWTSNYAASSASVFSPLTAASATLALKAGLWFRRGRRAMVSLVPGIMPRSGRKSTYPSCPDSPSLLLLTFKGARHHKRFSFTFLRFKFQIVRF